MSRLSEVLEVEEEQEFRFDDNLFYKIKGDCLFYRTEDDIWCKSVNGYILCKMIARPERIRIMPPKLQLTKQQITAIKGRIAEGTPWVARDGYDKLYFYANKPYKDAGYFMSYGKTGIESYSTIYDFVQYNNSPLYLPDLIEEH